MAPLGTTITPTPGFAAVVERARARAQRRGFDLPPGRIMMSLMGLMVAMLSVTGIVIWERKRRSRRLQILREAGAKAQRGAKPIAARKSPLSAR